MAVRLDYNFYGQEVLDVAPQLLGKLLVRKLETGELLKYRITETEAYCGEEDTACHARAGKTNRTSVLYEKGGLSYVYLCYGIHYLLNVVTGKKDFPQAVLIRGVEGYSGPAKLTKAIFRVLIPLTSLSIVLFGTSAHTVASISFSLL
jgi:DNA-3-methyladenine glycosylase